MLIPDYGRNLSATQYGNNSHKHFSNNSQRKNPTRMQKSSAENLIFDEFKDKLKQNNTTYAGIKHDLEKIWQNKGANDQPENNLDYAAIKV